MCTLEQIHFEEWLPTLDYAMSWNGWTNEESLVQLVRHLCGRALTELNLLHKEKKATYQAASQAWRTWLDPGYKTLAAQYFQHAMQKESETVADYIHGQECYFQIAYSHDKLTSEAKEAILFGQLQEGLSYEIMKSPSVSGTQLHNELCMVVKHE